MLLTNNKLLIDAAKRNYEHFLVPTNFVEGTKTLRSYTADEQADLDIATSKNLIGEIINLSQELNSLFWDNVNRGKSIKRLSDLYADISKLDVMSGIEIDKAKKEFAIDNARELKKIKKKYTIYSADGKVVKPVFMGHIAKKKAYAKNDGKFYRHYETTMDYVQHTLDAFRLPMLINQRKPLSCILDMSNYSIKKVNYYQIEKVYHIVRETRGNIQIIFDSQQLDMESKIWLASKARNRCISFINSIRFNDSTMYRLLCSTEEPRQKDIKHTLFNILFGTANKDFYKLLKTGISPIKSVEKCSHESSDIYLFDIPFTHIQHLRNAA